MRAELKALLPIVPAMVFVLGAVGGVLYVEKVQQEHRQAEYAARLATARAKETGSFAAVELLAQQHGDDVECSAICLPSDYPGDPPNEIDGAKTYTCSGACKGHETDPCAEGAEAGDCSEWCRKQCCECRKVHCP